MKNNRCIGWLNYDSDKDKYTYHKITEEFSDDITQKVTNFRGRLFNESDFHRFFPNLNLKNPFIFSVYPTAPNGNESQILEILKNLHRSIPEIIYSGIMDLNGNLLEYVYDPDYYDIDNNYAVPMAVNELAFQKIIPKMQLGKTERMFTQNENGYLVTQNLEGKRLLVIRTLTQIKLGLLFLDTNRTAAALLKIPYTPFQGMKNLKSELEELESRFLGKTKIFISYSKNDSNYFKIPKIAEMLEKKMPNIETMYFEKSIKPGEDILDYMERGVKWCNTFIWFHSKNSLASKAVQDEYKMAKYNGKKIISITEDFNILPMSAKIAWSVSYSQNLDEVTEKIIQGVQEDAKSITSFDWAAPQS